MDRVPINPRHMRNEEALCLRRPVRTKDQDKPVPSDWSTMMSYLIKPVSYDGGMDPESRYLYGTVCIHRLSHYQ